MIVAPDGSITSTTFDKETSISRLEFGESQNVQCPNGIVTRVAQYCGLLPTINDKFPISESGDVVLNVGGTRYTTRLDPEQNTISGLKDAIDTLGAPVFAQYFGISFKMSVGWGGAGQFSVLSPLLDVPITLGDGKTLLIDGKCRAVVNVPVEEIRSAVRLRYKPWFLPFSLTQERYFASTKESDGKYRFGAVSGADLLTRVQKTEKWFTPVSPGQVP
jgi:hypothetical protein